MWWAIGIILYLLPGYSFGIYNLHHPESKKEIKLYGFFFTLIFTLIGTFVFFFLSIKKKSFKEAWEQITDLDAVGTYEKELENDNNKLQKELDSYKVVRKQLKEEIHELQTANKQLTYDDPIAKMRREINEASEGTED